MECPVNRFHVMKRPSKMGLGSAYIAGFKWGMERGMTISLKWILTFLTILMLCHGSLRRWIKGYDLIIGSRYTTIQ